MATHIYNLQGASKSTDSMVSRCRQWQFGISRSQHTNSVL